MWGPGDPTLFLSDQCYQGRYWLPSHWAQQDSGGSCPMAGCRKDLNSNRADSQLPPFPSSLRLWNESQPGVRRPGPGKAGITPAPRVSRPRDTWVQISVFPLTSCILRPTITCLCLSLPICKWGHNWYPAHRIFTRIKWVHLHETLGREPCTELCSIEVRCYCIKMRMKGDFPGGPVAETPQSQCRGHGFDPIKELDPTYHN